MVSNDLIVLYLTVFFTFQLPTRLEENAARGVSRPVVLGQRLQRDHTSGPAEAVLLQGQLLDVQEDVRPEAQGDDQRIREAREEVEGNEGARTVEEAGRK